MACMFVRVWEYDVHPERLEAFVTAYGGDGDWVQLFGRAAGYVGTDLLRNTDEPTRFVTIDRWTDQASWLAFLEEWGEAYHALDASLAGLTVSQRSLVEG
jgi:quinol monooxygenase YgiN